MSSASANFEASASMGLLSPEAQAVAMTCVKMVLRALILWMGLMIGRHFFTQSQPKKSPSQEQPKPSLSREQLEARSSSLKERLRRRNSPAGKQLSSVSDDDDALSTSAGSSDADALSSDDEVEPTQGNRYSVALLLQCRPAATNLLPRGSLQAKRVDGQKPAAKPRTSENWRAASVPAPRTELPTNAFQNASPAPVEASSGSSRTESLLRLLQDDVPDAGAAAAPWRKKPIASPSSQGASEATVAAAPWKKKAAPSSLSSLTGSALGTTGLRPMGKI